jgi:hypothetical protein
MCSANSGELDDWWKALKASPEVQRLREITQLSPEPELAEFV